MRPGGEVTFVEVSPRDVVHLGAQLLALLLAPGLVGFVRWVKAHLQNRRGAPIWPTPSSFSSTSGWIERVGREVSTRPVRRGVG